MDIAGIAVNETASAQQGAQQRFGVLAIKNAADSQNQIASMLDKATQAEPKLRTSGSVGTNINTTA